METNRLPVKCFAPPMTEELLAKYEQITNQQEGRIKHIMSTCLEAVKTWWNLPESEQIASENFIIKHRKKNKRFSVIPLEKDHMDDSNESGVLWDVVPYEDELENMTPIIDKIQEEEMKRNIEKLEIWKKGLRSYLLSQTFTKEELDWIFGERRKTLRAVMSKLTDDIDVDKVIDAIEPGMTWDKMKEHAKKMQELDEKFNNISNLEEESPIARPTLESTEVRDAAKHLWWFTFEFCKNREPLTNEVLK